VPLSYQEFKVPTPRGADEVVVDVVASGLHHRVRSQADGSLGYFALGDTVFGAMADQTAIDLRQSIEVPKGIDPVHVAAAMNPAMSSWVALKRRTDFGGGQSVLVLGATGSSGQMAVQVAKLLGAEHVVAAGRGPRRLAALKDLGADVVVRLGDDPGLSEVAAEVDVIIDCLWGRSPQRR
jgi:NADPH:quinone reductase-like Zn-dependent oxidoreductase